MCATVEIIFGWGEEDEFVNLPLEVEPEPVIAIPHYSNILLQSA